MHTHFGSATHLAATFIGVLIAGTFWRLAWLRVLSWSTKNNSQVVSGLSRSALAQY